MSLKLLERIIFQFIFISQIIFGQWILVTGVCLDIGFCILVFTKTPLKGVFVVVGGEGVEPSWPCDRRILSPVRLPIPPLAPHSCFIQYPSLLGLGICYDISTRLARYSVNDTNDALKTS